MFPLGFSTIGCPHHTVDQIIDLAVTSGLPGVELRFVAGTTDFDRQPEFQPAQLATTGQKFRDHGLTVVSVDTSVRMCSLDPGERARQRDAARRWSEIAAGLSASYLRVFGGPIPEGQDRDQTLDAIASGLTEIAAISSAVGVQSLLETHDSFSTSASVLDLYERGASEDLGLLWDTLHTFRHGERPAWTWSQLGPRVKHVHLKDSFRASPDGFDLARMGDGVAPVAEILEVLHSNGYQGFGHFEWEQGWHPEVEDGSITIPLFAQYMASQFAGEAPTR